mgnify:FL=1|tara:strand:+ start:554 stop:1357 length:804 start_codon:yes stop_codon:yes gene_type:complete
MKKHVLFWIGVKSTDQHLQDKHGGFKYLDVSKKCWELWCKKNDVIFFEYNTTSDPDTVGHKVTWQRWFDLFPLLEEAGIDYDKICMIDGSTLVRADTPNFFELVDDGLTAFRSLENLNWVYEGVSGYKGFFNDYDFDIAKYVTCGFQIFGKEHKTFLEDLKEFYYKNYKDIMELQNNVVKRGTDQPVYNYLLQIHNIKVNTNLPKSYMITHLQRFDWFSYNWQLQKDNTPFFLKYGYAWMFSGFPNRGDRYNLMQQTWDIIKNQYEQ